MWQKLVKWYQKHRNVHVGISAVLFATQIIHLIWLTGNAVWPRLFGCSFFTPGELGEQLIAMADYLEIPAIISTSLLYVSDLAQEFSWKKIRLLTYINTQWIHIYWITDEFVTHGAASGFDWPVWLAWVAIGIDYLELPVIYDTSKQFFSNMIESRGSAD